MKYEFISVDLQNDFASEGGRHYRSRPSVHFLTGDVFTYLKERSIKISEITSDYRAPRPGYSGKGCEPGTWGYESIVPREIVKSVWIKSQNSPLWSRDNIGIPDKEPGWPKQDVAGFSAWLENNIGRPEDTTPVVFGLTVDCCVLSLLQELRWRGYSPLILEEGVDHYDGTAESKDMVLKSTARNWGKEISWKELKEKLSENQNQTRQA